MNFRVFARTLFLLAVSAAVVFTLYANIAAPEESGTEGRETGQAAEGGVPADDRAENGGGTANSGRETAGGGTTDNDGKSGSAETGENRNGSASESKGGEAGNSGENADGSGNTRGAADSGSGGEGVLGNKGIPGRNYVKENTTVVISALGDVALGQDHSFAYTDSFDYVYEKKGGDSGYFFSGVVDLLADDDLTIANLETTLGDETKKAEKYDYGNNYWFNGKPEYAGILKNGSVEIANLANNHTYDYGQEGFNATKKALDQAGIRHFGYGETLKLDVKGVKIGMAGFNQLGEYEQGIDMDRFKRTVEETIRELDRECSLVVASFHWGKEYAYKPDPVQKELARLAIDSGADLVIGHHPHVLQPIEEYKGRCIAYSLGNFCFGGNKKPKDFDTAIFRQTFTFDSNNTLQVIGGPIVIPCSLSSQKEYNNYRPVPVETPEIKKRIYEKLDFISRLGPEERAEIAGKSDMVRLDAAVRDIVIDLKYATSDNIAGKPIYESNIAYLRKGTADKLKKANSILLKHGYRIKVWDAYRAQKYQQALYDMAQNKSFFMDPKTGSNHTRGAAVDVTLVDSEGNEADMPSGFDEMSEKAHRTYTQATDAQKRNALLLENAMKSSGFIPLKHEWWHFDDSEYKSYGLIPEYPPED